MSDYLYQKIDTTWEMAPQLIPELPVVIKDNLNSEFELRPYQKEAFQKFIFYYNNDKLRQYPTEIMYQMATGSGKTIIMAGLMLYLYKKGYRNFLFFVHLDSIVRKTKDNFLNVSSRKYLFADQIVIDGETVPVNEVENFQSTDDNAINICFKTLSGLHSDMFFVKENSISLGDFEDKKIVLLSDEAHHLNAETKKSKAKKADEEDVRHWETTIQSIFHMNRENVLLDFTATANLDNVDVKAKLAHKLIFNYDIKKFRQDRYSKEINVLRTDGEIWDRVMYALILSQYRLKVFQDNKINAKPVVLLKSQKIKDEEETVKSFNSLIEDLDGSKIKAIFNAAMDNNADVVLKAQKYFGDNNISNDALAQEIKEAFSPEHCLCVNGKKQENRDYLTNLEDSDNPYRLVFDVQVLNEGWDVLNLFDIVRLYETRQSGGKTISATTVSEAQLIGRGARYYPFITSEDEEKGRRKYDDDLDCDLRICEELYYHCQSETRYFTELKQALLQHGIDLEETKHLTYELKTSFMASDIYNQGIMFKNRQEEVTRDNVQGINHKVHDKIFSIRFNTSDTGSLAILNDGEQLKNKPIYTVEKKISEVAAINYALVYKSMAAYPVFKFKNLHQYYPNIDSMRTFITNDEYLGGIKISIKSILEEPSIGMYEKAVHRVLSELSEVISGIEKTYQGTTDFIECPVRTIFPKTKHISYTTVVEGSKGYSQNDFTVKEDWRCNLSECDWFAYNDNYGTSEEKAFVAYFRDNFSELAKEYETIYLVRNERAFALYSFTGGRRFEPDYVVFLQKKKDEGFEQLQLFVEPKGDGLLENDAWKEEFLLEIAEKGHVVKKFKDDNEYKIFGLHFFNVNNKSKEFDDDFNAITMPEDE